MSSLTEAWLQDLITKTLGLPAVNGEVVEELLPFLELHVRRLIQQAHKYQRRSKSAFIRVSDINLVLNSNKVEPLYGLELMHSPSTEESAITANVQRNIYSPAVISIEDFSTRDIPTCSLKQSVSLHWLAVNGVQPSIPENPSIVDAEDDKRPVSLPQELQYLYARITGIIKNFDQNEDRLLSKVLSVLKRETCLQDLVPYFSHFCYSQVKSNAKNVPLLSTIIKTIRALCLNESLHLENHLQQLLPAVFTCVIAAKLSNYYTENHWSLRREAAQLISLISHKYSAISSDLHPRICKTFLDAISQKKSLAVAYGGVVGIKSLGAPVIRTLLLDNLANLRELIQTNVAKMGAPYSIVFDEARGRKCFVQNNTHAEIRLAVDMLEDAIRQALGEYMASCMRLPTLPWTSAKNQPKRSYQLCDMEESLTPYFATESKALFHSRMVL